MADEKFVKTIELQFKGIRESLDEVLQTGKGVEDLAKKVGDAEKEFDKLSAAAAKTGDSKGVQKLSGELEQLKKRAQEAQAQLQKAMEADVSVGGMGRPEEAVRLVDAELIQDAIRYANIISGQVVPANEKATKEAARLGEALSKTYGAMNSQQFEASIAGMSKLEQAQLRLTRAARQHYDANQKFMAAEANQGSHEERIRTYREMERAAQGLQRAEAAVNAEQRKLDLSKQREQLQISEKLGESMGRLSRVDSNRAFEAQIKGLTELEQAQARYLRLVEQEESARTRAAHSSAGTQEQVKALQELEKAAARTDQAWTKLQATQKKEDSTRIRREAKETQELEKSVQRLATAKRAADEAIPKQGTDRVAQAMQNEKNATNELAQARWDYMQLVSSGTATSEQLAKAHYQVAEAQDRQTKSQKVLLQEQERAVNTLPRLRYALYDVSRTLTRMGVAFTGAAAGVGVVATKMERDFADVIRTTESFRDTTGATARSLKRDFEDLYSAMPADWADLTRIGEMAGQMNIAAGDVANFTKTITQMASATDMSVESATTTIGRLSVLLDVSASEYDNLASSILSVGVNSVATESQIAEISQQIAGIAGTAGLSADEVVGLSSALASIGTAPELSRGIVTRFFTNLMEATSLGGERLQKFAAVSGMTAEQFRKAWADDAAGAFQAVIKGLGRVEESRAIEVLKELGIQQVRDIPAVLKLAQNHELLARSMDIAAQGYAEGSALAEHYGVISETMSEKIHVLKNQFALLLEALGQFAQTDFFKGLVEMATRAVELLTALANTPVARWAGGVGIAIGALVGGVALLGGAITSAMAASYGLRTALANLIPLMGATSAGAASGTTSLRALMGQMAKTTGAAKALRLSLMGLGAGVALGALAFGLSLIAENVQNSTRRVNEMKSALSGMGEAFAIDTKTLDETGEAFRVIPLRLRETSEELSDAEVAFRQITGASRESADAFGEVEGAAKDATVAIGKEVVMAVTSAMLSQEEFVNSLKGAAVDLRDYGFNLAEFIEQMVSEEGVDDYLKGIREQIDAAKEELKGTFYGQDYTQSPAYQSLQNLEKVFEELTGQAEAFKGEVENVTFVQGVMGSVADLLGIDMDELSDSFEEASIEADTFRSVLEGFDSSAHEFQGTMYDLADALIQNGGAFDEFSQEGRASMAALESAFDSLWDQSENAEAFAFNLADMFAYLEGAEISLEGQTDMLTDALVGAFGSEWVAHLDTTAAHGSIKSFLDAVVAALKARAEIERDTFKRSTSSGVAAAMAGDFQKASQYASQAAKAFRDEQVISQQISAVQGLAQNLSKAGDAGTQAGRQIRDGLSGGGRGGGGGGGKSPAKKAADDVKDLQKEIYTLKDYASDLSEIWSRAFDIRFSGQATIDSATKSFRDLAQRFEDAENNVKDLRIQLQVLRGDLQGLKAEISKQEYFLSIATEYGDTARAEQIQARLAELQAELAGKQKETSDTSKELTRAQEETSRSLEGNSDAAIQNRSDLMNLVKQYQDHVGALAESGMNSKDLQKETEKLRQDFIKQATQLGFNRQELKKYENGFKDMKVAIDKVPRNITVKANTNPAMQAVNEWIAKVRKKQASMTVKANVSAPKSLKGIGGQLTPSSIRSSGPIYAPSLKPYQPLTFSATLGGGGRYVMQMRRKGGLANTEGPLYRASGGPAEWAKMYSKGTDTIPAMLTPGEYVVKKKAVDFYGPEVMRAINNMQVPKRFFTASGWEGRGNIQGSLPGGQRVMVDLTPSSVQALAHAVRPMLKVGDTVIAGAANRESVNSSSFGRG